MNNSFYNNLAQKSIAGELISYDDCRKILSSAEIELLSLINAAFEVRRKYTGKTVTLHIINNVQNGLCSQDCQYCAQSLNSQARIETYTLKTDEEIMAEAKEAFKSGAFRHCLVFSGPKQSQERIEHLAGLIKEMKARFSPMEVCVSPGFVTDNQAQILKDAGLNRLNHNINSSKRYYTKICSTHEYQDRINTLNAAKNADLEICSGVIIGMGEKEDDVINVALTLREIQPKSLPVNFFLPIEGLPLKQNNNLTPEYCLRVLCLYRFLNPKTELRVAAGREVQLRDMEVMCLYPANSIFINGYLNVKGSSRTKTLQMIKDAGFTIESEYELDDLLEKEDRSEKIENRLEMKVRK